MSIKIALNHKTQYHFDREVNLSPHTIRLRPASHNRMPIEAYSLKIEPKNHFINWQQDPFGNHIAKIVFQEKSDRLLIEVDLIAKLIAVNPFDFFIDEYARQFPFDYDPILKNELLPYLTKPDDSPLFAEWMKEVNAIHSSMTIDYLSDLNKLVNKRIGYVIRLEHGVQSSNETLERGTGACRDMAWLLIQTLHKKGLAARFVSGYLIQLKTSGYLADDRSKIAQDFTDLHAWVEVYLPGAGWVGFDPTSGTLAGEGYIPLCGTPEPASASPILGHTDVCEVKFDFSMSVSRLDPLPPITHADPYSIETWDQIDKLGQQIEKDLQDSDVRLTMGGEPTFSSIDNPDTPEWSVAALGEEKYTISVDLMKRLLKRSHEGALLLHGQGKWYNGEELPRWSLGCYWRKDGEPLWNRPDLFADEPPEKEALIENAQQYIYKLAEYLDVPQKHILPAYEDAQWEQLFDAETFEAASKQRENAIGFVLPLIECEKPSIFKSPQWTFSRKNLFLMPGTSPLGYRLPLKHVEINHQPIDYVPTALCVELRKSIVCVFLPPIKSFENYEFLIRKLEKTAIELGCPVLIEGYSPPNASYIEHFQITPDPGVIEINVRPSKNWEELKNVLTVLYQEAKKGRLTTEKYLLDGRRVGAGGGHHIVIGGTTVDDSPILRRPDLLQSILTFWQNHPSLSYFFSGIFVGPTSQAPRIDEARHEGLYELEIAFSLLPTIQKGRHDLVDRLFRNLLVDTTGNTHRTEISIDKLYDPYTPFGRQGLLEFRGFEMQPHANMCLLQLLLVRALIAYFWKKPYQHRLVRWGTQLHDRWMLPHFLWLDLCDIIRELNQYGYAFQTEWFRPMYDFRFPKYGSAQIENVTLELSMALEPWNVLGEENVGGNTSRTVDSSTERLQVIVRGLTPERYLVTCNNRCLPLHPGGTKGEYIAGVRFKAWNPPRSLHPNMPLQAPLHFDLYDKWLNRSLGGCTYNVAHPGGVNYVKLPVNGKDAEARRLSRFEAVGHTPGTHFPPIEPLNEEYPYTLDLRRLAKFSPQSEEAIKRLASKCICWTCFN